MGQERRLLPSLPPQAFGRAREAFPTASTAPPALQTVGRPPSVLWPSEPASWPRTCKPALYKKSKRAACSLVATATSGLAAASGPQSPRRLQTHSDQGIPEWVLDVGPLSLEILGATINITPRDSPPRRRRGRSAPESSRMQRSTTSQTTLRSTCRRLGYSQRGPGPLRLSSVDAILHNLLGDRARSDVRLPRVQVGELIVCSIDDFAIPDQDDRRHPAASVIEVLRFGGRGKAVLAFFPPRPSKGHGRPFPQPWRRAARPLGDPPAFLWPSEPASWSRTCKRAFIKNKKGGLQPPWPLLERSTESVNARSRSVQAGDRGEASLPGSIPIPVCVD